MAETPRELGDFKGVGHFEAKFQIEGYVSRQCLWTIDRGIAVLQLRRLKLSLKETL